MKKVHVLDLIHPRAVALLTSQAEMVGWDDPTVADLSDADAVLVRTSKVTRDMMRAAPRLKVIAKHGVGTDNIDLAAAKERGVMVVFTPDANMQSVAELVFALLFAVARQVPEGDKALRSGALRTMAPRHLSGLELAGKTLGLLGLGRIGRRVAAIGKNGFDMRVVGYDPYLPDAEFTRLGITRAAGLEQLLPQADCISISMPKTPETENLLNRTTLALCKPTAILVNTSRGGLVDEEALYHALQSGALKGAASDVFVQEPPSRDNPLFTLPNFVGTPHVGAATEESLIRMGEGAVRDILCVLNGEKPQCPWPGFA